MMESAQTNYELSDRLIRAISNLRTFSTVNDDIEQLLESGADVNRLHGTLLPLQCACMVSDAYCLQLLLEKGAMVCQFGTAIVDMIIRCVGKGAGLMIERLRVQIPAGAVGVFSSPELTLCADSNSVFISLPCYHNGT